MQVYKIAQTKNKVLCRKDGIYYVLQDGAFDHEIEADSMDEALDKFFEECK